MSTYLPTIGLEIHAELKTATKMFCRSKNDPFTAVPNTHICPICMAHPGTLPVINREAVRSVLRMGVAIGGSLADYTEFDRKNYFYPDLPKGYQLSQYAFPLVQGGELCGVAITRVHLEEDTAASTHDRSKDTLVDYNRAGVPLMELVTEPVIHTAKQAGEFGRELQLLLRYLGISDADMEKGNMRLEANISVSKSDTLGTKVEVKNINSFRSMERAIEYEVKRQSALLERGESIMQETRGWDDAKQATFSQRSKEGSADYRYFPDPDLPSLRLSEIAEFDLDTLKRTLPELPRERRLRYRALGIKDADGQRFTARRELGDFFDAVTSQKGADFVRLAASYIANDLSGHIREVDTRDTENKDILPVSVSSFAELIDLLVTGRISSRSAKELLGHLVASGNLQKVVAIAKDMGMLIEEGQNTDQLAAVVVSILAQNIPAVTDYKSGKEAALQFILGQCMRALKGAANPEELRHEILKAIAKM